MSKAEALEILRSGLAIGPEPAPYGKIDGASVRPARGFVRIVHRLAPDGRQNANLIGRLLLVGSVDETGITFSSFSYVETGREVVHVEYSGRRVTTTWLVRYAKIPGSDIKFAFADVSQIVERIKWGFIDYNGEEWCKDIHEYDFVLGTGDFGMYFWVPPQSSNEVLSAFLALCPSVK
jgi:hypothetical protein